MFKYFGSKWKGSKHYPEPRYPLIVEPFAGSACYASRYADLQVMLLDKDPEVAALWQWLIAADPAEVLRLPSTELPLGLDLREISDAPREALDLIRRWQRIGHCSCWTVSSWNCKPGMWGPDIVQHVAESLTQIRHWEAFQVDDYSDIPVSEIGEATWFIDPLYQFGGKGGYECHKPHDYKHLAQWVRSLPGQVIVCEQEGANWLPFRPSHECTGIKRRVHHKKANTGLEMFWLNDWKD
jgi:hypothetical protein